MKLSEIPKGTRAVRSVPFRLSNAPRLEPGVEKDEHTYQVGIRVLTTNEVGSALQKAMEDAAQGGVAQWLDTHPLCRLREMEHVVLLACVDIDSGERAEPFFVSLEQLRNHDGITADNLVYLYTQWKLWQDECSPPNKSITPGELIAMVLEEAARPENAPDGPFSRLGPSVQQSCFHSMAVLLTTSQMVKSLTTSPAEPPTKNSSPKKRQNQPNARQSKAGKATRGEA